jgi:hypothetical protein
MGLISATMQGYCLLATVGTSPRVSAAPDWGAAQLTVEPVISDDEGLGAVMGGDDHSVRFTLLSWMRLALNSLIAICYAKYLTFSVQRTAQRRRCAASTCSDCSAAMGNADVVCLSDEVRS